MDLRCLTPKAVHHRAQAFCPSIVAIQSKHTSEQKRYCVPLLSGPLNAKTELP